MPAVPARFGETMLWAVSPIQQNVSEILRKRDRINETRATMLKQGIRRQPQEIEGVRTLRSLGLRPRQNAVNGRPL